MPTISSKLSIVLAVICLITFAIEGLLPNGRVSPSYLFISMFFAALAHRLRRRAPRP